MSLDGITFLGKRISLALALILLISSCSLREGNSVYSEAVEFWRKGDYDEAVQNLISLTKSYPNHPLVDDALFLTGGIYRYYMDEPKNAIRYFTILVKNFPDSEYYNDAMLNVSEIYADGNSKEKSMAISFCLELLTKNNPGIDVEDIYYRIGKIYVDLENYAEARKYFKYIIQNNKDPELAAQAYFFIGISFYNEGHKKLSEITFNEAISKYENRSGTLDSMIGLANIYEESNQVENAINMYKKISKTLDENDSLLPVVKDRISSLAKLTYR